MSESRKKSEKKKQPERKTVNLALQGGGAHGAYAWGVLDALLEDGRLDIEGICATSAGTMNACALASGMQKAVRDGKTSDIDKAEYARRSLHDFWREVYQAGVMFSPVKRMPWDAAYGWNMDHSLSAFMFDSWTRLFSPYQYNPFDINPLRDVLKRTLCFDSISSCDCMKLFISATHVKTGKIKVFETKEIDLDVAMASACLPFLYKAVDIDGEDYWDGGYMGNPALFPLFYKTKTRDVIIVHINPLKRDETPTTAPDIMNRINEISFNSSLLGEMRAIAFVKKLIELDMLKDEHKADFKNILVHSVRADQALNDLSVTSKFNSDWDFLTMLRDKGRATMQAWLKKNYDAIGQHDTVDLNAEFLNSTSQLFKDKGDHLKVMKG